MHKYPQQSQKAQCKPYSSLRVRGTLKSTKDPRGSTIPRFPKDTVIPSLYCPNLLKMPKLK